MTKNFITYFLMIFLLVTLAAPSLCLLIENDAEIEQYEPIEDENQDKEYSEDFEEIKMHYIANITLFYNSLVEKKQHVFHAKKYTSDYKKLDTPPPELIA